MQKISLKKYFKIDVRQNNAILTLFILFILYNQLLKSFIFIKLY